MLTEKEAQERDRLQQNIERLEKELQLATIKSNIHLNIHQGFEKDI